MSESAANTKEPRKPNELVVRTTGNRVAIQGYLDSGGMRRVLSAMYKAIHDKGYSDIELDFSDCTRAGSGAMLGIMAQTRRHLRAGVDTYLKLPQRKDLRRLFLNTNWAHLIDFRSFEESDYKGSLHIPALRYRDGSEQYEAVSAIMSVLLGALPDFDRSHFRSIEWSLNEITDNVLNHSESPDGGFVQLTNFTKIRVIQITVCDAGVGIPQTIREGHPEITSDQEALDRAIREGITRDKGVGQGNGLYGSWRIARISKGGFFINSGNASLISTEKIQLHASRENIPYLGTVVSLKIKHAVPHSLEEALQFEGKIHKPVDLIELKYEEDESGNIPFILIDEAKGLGTRTSGVPVRTKLENLSHMVEDKKIVVDFNGIHLVSSSFADEVFGKLFADVGPMAFVNKFEFRNIDPLVESLIDLAIKQRFAIKH